MGMKCYGVLCIARMTEGTTTKTDPCVRRYASSLVRPASEQLSVFDVVASDPADATRGKAQRDSPVLVLLAPPGEYN